MNPSESLTPKIFAPCYMFYHDKFCPVPNANVCEKKNSIVSVKAPFFFLFSTK